MENIKLSICIPTYNMWECLHELLDKLNCCGLPETVEVCISDNASQDKTSDHFIEKCYPENTFRFHKNETNLGADKNFLQSVSMARGEYVWIIGADDNIDGLETIEYVLDLISDSKFDIYTFDRLYCDNNLSNGVHQSWMSCPTSSFHSYKSEDRINYFKVSNSLGSIFSYLSTTIFRKERWDRIENNEQYIGTNYIHSFKLLSIFKEGADIKYTKRPIVNTRSGNDSFMDKGVVNRINIDIDGFQKLSEIFSDNSEESEEFINILMRDRPYFYTLMLVGCYGSESQKTKFRKHFNLMGVNDWLITLLYKISPIAYLYRKLK